MQSRAPHFASQKMRQEKETMRSTTWDSQAQDHGGSKRGSEYTKKEATDPSTEQQGRRQYSSRAASLLRQSIAMLIEASRFRSHGRNRCRWRGLATKEIHRSTLDHPDTELESTTSCDTERRPEAGEVSHWNRGTQLNGSWDWWKFVLKPHKLTAKKQLTLDPRQTELPKAHLNLERKNADPQTLIHKQLIRPKRQNRAIHKARRPERPMQGAKAWSKARKSESKLPREAASSAEQHSIAQTCEVDNRKRQGMIQMQRAHPQATDKLPLSRANERTESELPKQAEDTKRTEEPKIRTKI